MLVICLCTVHHTAFIAYGWFRPSDKIDETVLVGQSPPAIDRANGAA